MPNNQIPDSSKINKLGLNDFFKQIKDRGVTFSSKEEATKAIRTYIAANTAPNKEVSRPDDYAIGGSSVSSITPNKEAILRKSLGDKYLDYSGDRYLEVRPELSDYKQRIENNIKHVQLESDKLTANAPKIETDKIVPYGMNAAFNPPASDYAGEKMVSGNKYDASSILHDKTSKDFEAADGVLGKVQMGIGNIGRNWGNRPVYDWLSLGLAQTGRDFSNVRVLEKAAKNEPLTEAEQLQLKSYQTKQDALAYRESQGGQHWTSKTGQTIQGAMDFAAGLALTGGFGTVAKAASGAVAKTLPKLGTNTLTNKATSAVLSTIAQTPLMHQTYGNINERYGRNFETAQDVSGEIKVTDNNSVSAGEAIGKGFGSSVAEVITEKSGVLLGGLFSKTVGKISPKLETTLSKIADKTAKLYKPIKASNIDSAPEEILEEYLSAVIEPLLTAEPERIKENFKGENLWETTYLAGGVAVLFGGGNAILSKGASTVNRVARRTERAKLKAQSNYYLSEISAPGISDLLKNEITPNSSSKDITKTMERLGLEALSEDDIQTVFDYTTTQQALGVINGVRTLEEYQAEQDAINELLSGFKTISLNQLGGEVVYATLEDGRECVITSMPAEDNADQTVGIIDSEGEYSRVSKSSLANIRSTPVEYCVEQAMEKTVEASNKRIEEADEAELNSEDLTAQYIRDDTGRNLFINGVDAENGAYRVVEFDPETYTFNDKVELLPFDRIAHVIGHTFSDAEALGSGDTTSNSEVGNVAQKATSLADVGQVGAGIVERWKRAPKVTGHKDIFTTPDGTKLAGRWVLVEADAPTASHDYRNFSLSEGFPIDKNGATVNDRDYSHDKSAQAEVYRMAKNLDSRAIDNPVIVTKDGVVISGNNRTMSSQLAANESTDAMYIEELQFKAPTKGITVEALSEFEHPRLVFEVETPLKYTAATFAKFNTKSEKAKSPLERAVTAGKVVTDEAIDALAHIIDGYGSVSELNSSVADCKSAVQIMLSHGIVQMQELAEYYDNGQFTPVGKEYLEAILLGKILSEHNLRLVGSDGFRNYRKSLIAAIVPLIENKTLGAKYSLVENTNEALLYIDRVRNGGFTNLAELSRQLSIFEAPEFINEDSALISFSLEKRLDLKKILTEYNTEAKEAAIGLSDMFEGNPLNREQILTPIKTSEKYEQRIDEIRTNNNRIAQAIEARGKRDERRDSAIQPDTPKSNRDGDAKVLSQTNSTDNFGRTVETQPADGKGGIDRGDNANNDLRGTSSTKHVADTDVLLREGATPAEVNNRFNRELQQLVRGELPQHHVFDLGIPGEVLRSVGVPNLPIQLAAKRLNKKANQANHIFDVSDVANLPNAIQSPIAVFSYNNGRAVNIITLIDSNGKKILVGLYLNESTLHKGLNTIVNNVYGIFPKDNSKWLNWIAKGEALYIDKKRALDFLDQQRTVSAEMDLVQTNKGIAQENLELITKVINNFENPKNVEEILLRDFSKAENGKDSLSKELTDAEVNRRFNWELQQLIAGKLQAGHVFKLGMPGEKLRLSGVPDLPIELEAAKLIEKSESRYKNYHPFELSDVKNLPSAIQNPIAIFDSKTKYGYKVIFTELKSNGNNFVVAIHINSRKGKYNNAEVLNSIRSIYPKDVVKDVVSWINRGDLLVYADKTKILSWITQQQYKPADVAIPKEDLNIATKVINNFENPKNVEEILLRDFAEPRVSKDPVEINAKLDALESRFNIPVERVATTADLPDNIRAKARGRRVKGVYDKAGDKVYIVMGNNNSTRDVEATYMHEVVAHKGLRAMLGEKHGDMLDAVYNSMSAENKAEYETRYGDNRFGDSREVEFTLLEGNEFKGSVKVAKAWGKINLPNSLPNMATGRDIKLSRKSIGELSRIDTVETLGNLSIRLEALRVLPQLVSKAAIGYSHPDYRENKAIKAINRMYAPLKYKGIDYSVLLTVKEYFNGDVELDGNMHIYAMRVAEIEKADHHARKIASIDSDLSYKPTLSTTNIQNLINSNIQEREKIHLSNHNTKYRHLIAEEYIASIAEGNITPGAFSRAIAAVRKFFREHLGINLSISDNDIRYMLHHSADHLARKKGVLETIEYHAKDAEISDTLFREAEAETETAVHLSPQKRELSKSGAVHKILFDNTLPLINMMKQAKAEGLEVTEGNDASIYTDKVKARAVYKIKKLEDQYFTAISKVLVDLGKSHDINYGAVSRYLLAKSAIERQELGTRTMNKDENEPWNEMEVAKIVADFERRVSVEEQKKLWSTINDFTQMLLKQQLSYGLISASKYEAITSKYKYYVPQRGFAEPGHTLEQERVSPPRGADVTFDNTMVAKGRVYEPADPLGHLMTMLNHIIIQGETNYLHQRLAQFCIDNKGNEKLTDFAELSKKYYMLNKTTGQYEEVAQPSLEEIEQNEEATKTADRYTQLIRKRAKELKALKDSNKYEDRMLLLNMELTDMERCRKEALERVTLRTDIVDIVPTEPLTKKDTKIFNRRHQVDVMLDGVSHKIVVTDVEVAAAIRGVNKGLTQWVITMGDRQYDGLKYVQKGTRALAGLATSYNPAFLIPNHVRDVIHAGIYHAVDKDGNFVEFYKNMGVAYTAIIRSSRQGKAMPLTIAELRGRRIADETDRLALIKEFGANRVNDTLYDLFLALGGKTAISQFKTPEEVTKQLMKRHAEAGTTWGDIKIGWDSTWGRFSDLSETSTRFATFLAQLDSGNTLLSATSYAKNITVNFDKKGTVPGILSPFFMFLNANLQGLANMLGLAYRNKAKFAVLSAMFMMEGFFSALINEWQEGDEEDPYDINDWTKYTNIVIGARWGKPITIPLPHIVRLMHTVGYVAAELMMGKKSLADGGMVIADSFFNVFSPLGSPTNGFVRNLVPDLVKPLYDLPNNTTFFGGRIYRESFALSQDGTTPQYRMAKESCTPLFVGVSKMLNYIGSSGQTHSPAGLRSDGSKNKVLSTLFDINPDKMEYVFKYYTSGLGKFGTDLINTIITGIDSDKDIKASQVPISRNFYGQGVRPSTPEREYYELLKELKTLKTVYSSAIKEEQPVYAPTLDETKERAKNNAKRLKIFKRASGKIDKIEDAIFSLKEGSKEYMELSRERHRLMREALLECEGSY